MIRKFNYDVDEANSFIVGEEGGSCILIDVGKRAGKSLFPYIAAHYSKLEGIFITHGHFDHIEGLVDAPQGVPIFISAEDVSCLTDPRKNASVFLGGNLVLPDSIAPYLMEDEDEIALPSFSLKVIATPFHTPGCVCLYYEKGEERALFTGDTIGAMGIGRTDLPGGRASLIGSSLGKLSKLDPSLTIYPGHGPSSSLGKALVYAKKYY